MKPVRSRKGLWLIAALALIAAAVIVFFACAGRGRVALRSLTVLVDGKEYLSTPLKPGEAITVRQENGSENVIRMTENGFYMESATCPNQDCIAQGEVNTENWRQRKLLQQVICLPNRVTVALDLTDAENARTEAGAADLPDI